MYVVDRGADVTIFAFSTAFRRGKSQYEFQGLLNRIGDEFNLVFLRDVSRTIYQLTPWGDPGGGAFHADELTKIKDDLGASYNVAIGMSSGGNAALYFATRCNFDRNVEDTTPVGMYSPHGDSPYGCVDMAGNVYEWCHSLYKDYLYNPADGREDPETGGPRMLRGGAFGFYQWDVRCAHRFGYDPDRQGPNFGFRVVVAPGS